MTPHVLLLLESHATGGVTTIASSLAQGLRQRGWPVTETVVRGSRWIALWAAARRCDVILASHNFAPAYVAWLLGVLGRKPTIVWVHGPVSEVLDHADASWLKRRWLAWLYRRLHHCVFVSHASRDSFKRFLGGSTAKSESGASVVIGNAVVLGPTAPARPLASGTAVELAYVGRLSPEKQPQVLLDMLRRLPARFRLALVGDGPSRPEVEQAGADLLAAGRLRLLGFQPAGSSLYSPWDLTVLASRYEG